MSEKNIKVQVPNVDHRISKNRKHPISGHHESKINKMKLDKTYSVRSMPNSPKNQQQITRNVKHKIKKRRNGDVTTKALEMKRLWETARRFFLVCLY